MINYKIKQSTNNNEFKLASKRTYAQLFCLLNL